MTALTVSEAIVPVAPYQQVTGSDLSAIGTLGQGSLDNVVANILISGAGYSGMGASQVGTSNIVAVQPGYLIKGGPAYSLRDAFSVDVTAAINSVPDSAKTALVAIVADGQVFPTTETRTFVDSSKLPTDPTTPAPTVTQATPTRNVRSVVISSPIGTPDVQPALPSFSNTLCLIATVTVSNTAIVSVAQNTSQQITRLDQIATMIAALNAFQATVAPIISQLQSTVSALALSVNARFASIAAEFAADEARINALEGRVSAPASATFTGADYFTDLTGTDLTNTGAAVPGDAYRIGSGLAFPNSGVQDGPLIPINPASSDIKIIGNLLMPAYQEVAVAGAQYTYDPAYAQYGSSSISFPGLGAFLATLSLRGFGLWHTRWAKQLAAVATSQLLLNGNPDQIFPVVPTDLSYNSAAWGDWRTATTDLLRQIGYWRDCATRGFWSPIKLQEQVALPVIAQGFSPTGDVMVTSVFLAGIVPDSTQPMRLFMMDSVNGIPDPTRVYADVTYNTYGATLRLPYPVLVKGGSTVFFVFATSGNVSLKAMTYGTQSSFRAPLLVNINGGWTRYQGQNANELAMTINAAQFANGVTRVPLQALTLAGGIDGLNIAASSIVPDGCSIDYEVQVGGSYVPVAQPSGAHPLAGRPSSLPTNLLLSGTPSVAPIIDLSASKARVSAQGTAMQHTSTAQTPAATVHTVNQQLIVSNWNGNVETLSVNLLTGSGFGTVVAPTSAPVDTIQADGTLLRKFTWSVPAGLTTWKFQQVGATTDATQSFTVRSANWDAEA